MLNLTTTTNIKERIFTFFPIRDKSTFFFSLLFKSTISSHIPTVAWIVGELRVGAPVWRGVPYVQIHVWSKGIEAGVLFSGAGAAWFTAEGCDGWDGRVGRDRSGALWVEVVLVRFALRCPDRAKKTGHGWQTSGSWKVWLEKKNS